MFKKFEKNLKSFIFMFVLCGFCGVLITIASAGLKNIQEKNILLDKQKNILKTIGLIQEDKKYLNHEIEDLYKKNIKNILTDAGGKIIQENQRSPKTLPMYLYIKNNNTEAYILPIETQGLWGKIMGYLAIKNDGSTIQGFTVYQHSETPGLGGEIEKAWFQKNFKDKKIIDQLGGLLSVSVAKGSVKDTISRDKQAFYVDGISGATLTGKFLTEGLKNILLEYEPVSIQFRQNKQIKIN